MIAADGAAIFKGANPAQAWRRSQSDAFGQIDIGHPAVALQQFQNLSIDRIKRHCAIPPSGSPFPFGGNDST
jgi:hypothetical protein